MTTGDETPRGRLARSLVGGKTAAGMGGTYMKYLAEKPFLSQAGRDDARKRMSEKSAETLFNGLCRLKGTALKTAQLLSLEMDIFPEEMRAQLERSYNEVPPMNRALARKVLVNAYGAAPEEVFESFEGKAFAAASLGQVHRARSRDGRSLALKIQYPGIRETIRNDVRLLKGLLRPFAEYRLIKPAVEEIESRFMEETEYRLEAANADFFRENLGMEQVYIPQVQHELCTDQVLCLEYLDGTPLNAWLRTNPDARSRDIAAQRLEDIFMRSLYEMRCLHADPNPGNFLVFPDLTVGLVDFGCVKRLDAAFVELYRKLPAAFYRNDSDVFIQALRQFGTIPEDSDGSLEKSICAVFTEYGEWLKKIFAVEVFDFSKEKDFIKEGKTIFSSMGKIWRQMNINPDFIFLDRTRYGLLRLFEKMEARVSFRNPYEWSEAE